MLKLYKYMPLSILKEFLRDPCLRVTPAACQNDPFEFGLPANDVNTINSISGNKGISSQLESHINEHGIISLSECKNSILMWSHYSNSHRGVAVELLVDLKKPLKLFSLFSVFGFYGDTYYDYLFSKINYSKKRTLFDNKTKNISSLASLKNHYYFTKSIDWKYEDEHRYIMPYHMINKILFLKSKKYEITKLLTDNNYGAGVIRCNEETGMFSINQVTIEHIIISKLHILTALWEMSNENEIMFFIKLNSDHIGKIYLGCDSNINLAREHFESFNDDCSSINNQYYSEISEDFFNIEKCYIDENEFKISSKNFNFEDT